MRKKISLLLVFIILICMSACSSISNSETKEEKEANFLNNIISTNVVDDNTSMVDETTSTTKNENITHTDIEKVIIVCMDVVEEYTEEEYSFDFIDNIKNCNTVPKTSLSMDVGYIQIKYVGKEEPEDFAKLYLGLDGRIYAKYSENIDSKFAYKFR